MTAFRRIAIGCLVGLVFAAGFGARLSCAAREETLAHSLHRTPLSMPGTQVASVDGAASVDLRPLEIVITILESLRKHYVDQITPQEEGKMTHDSLRAMLGALNDPNTRFVDPEQRKLIGDASEGTYHGIGAILGLKRVKTGDLSEEHLVVITPIESGPAAAAGIRPGDDIVEVDGRPVLPLDPFQRANLIIKEEWNKKAVERSQVRKHLNAEQKRIESGIPVMEAEAKLASQDDKELELTIVRKVSGKETKVKVKVQPREFEVTPVASKFLDGEKLGYVKINCLARDTGRDFQDAIRQMKSDGARGLVVDLRNVAGSDMLFAKEIAAPLVPGKTLAVELRSRGRRSTLRVEDCPPDDAWRGPIAVLVNSGTARMSEVLAAAIKDGASAQLVGEKTYGDFSEATLWDQRDGSAVVMTTGEFLTSKGGKYNGKGLPVDVEVSSGSGDPQLKEAIRLLASAGGRG